MKRTSIATFALFTLIACTQPSRLPENQEQNAAFQEKYLKNIRQLTFNGTSLRPQWSPNGQWVTYQYISPQSEKCSQIFKISRHGGEATQISQGRGTAVDPSFLPKNKRILFSSNMALDSTCPPSAPNPEDPVEFLNPLYQIYGALPNGMDALPLEPSAPRAYNAEAKTCRDGSVVFTSDRKGFPALYQAKIDSFGSFQGVQSITSIPGLYGGASFSPDCAQIVWHQFRPKGGRETQNFEKLLKKHKIHPRNLEIWIANPDGSNPVQITHLESTSYAPVFTPDGKQILFTHRSKEGTRIALAYLDGRVEEVANSGIFDGFPAFSPDGKHLVFSSKRNAKTPTEIHLFMADWQGP